MFELSMSTPFNPTSPYHHLYSTDKHHIILGCNEWQAKDVGLLDSDELIGKHVFDFYKKVEAEVFVESNETVLKTGVSQLFEEFCILNDDTRMILSTYKYPLKNEKNTIFGVFGMTFPIELIPSPLEDGLLKEIPEDIHRLTPKQLTCLYWLLSGVHESKLSLRMGVHKNIIQQYMAHIFLKLGCKNLNELFLQYGSREDMLEWRSNFQNSLYNASNEEGRTIPHALENYPVKLTHQQYCCFQFILQGFTAKDIAQQMNLSYRTIQHYTAEIYERLGLKNSRELISHYAGLVS